MKNITLEELNNAFVNGRACVGLSMIPESEGSIIGILQIKGEIY